ncbi:MAG: hypothetical protein GYA15_14095 [Leptolinea sp.]|jgi:hypothetical protein|nr:hypothetical protein [Leptolinea sp.]
MLKLLKWNSLDIFYRYAWLIFIGLVSLAIAALVPSGTGTLIELLFYFAHLLGFLFFLSTLFLALYQCFGWLRHSSAMLELSLPAAAWKLLLSRVILAVVINAVACLGLILMMQLYHKHVNGVMEPLTVDQVKSIAVAVLILLTMEMTVLFSYLIARSIGLFHFQAAFITAVLSGIFLPLIVVFCGYVMVWMNVLTLPHFSLEHILIIDGNMRVSSWMPALAACGWIALLEYLGSSLLLKYSVQGE